MTQKKELLAPGARVRVGALRNDASGEQIPDDIVGKEGIIKWVTPGYAGEKGAFEIELDDGRIFNLYAPEIEPIP